MGELAVKSNLYHTRHPPFSPMRLFARHRNGGGAGGGSRAAANLLHSCLRRRALLTADVRAPLTGTSFQISDIMIHAYCRFCTVSLCKQTKTSCRNHATKRNNDHAWLHLVQPLGVLEYKSGARDAALERTNSQRVILLRV